MERFYEIIQANSLNALIKFHTTNKYLLMAFSPSGLNTLGNIVANHDDASIFDLIQHYKTHLELVISKSLTRKKHANVLRKMYGHFCKKLPNYKKERIEFLISEYQDSKIELDDVLRNLKELTSDIDNIYVARQSYFLLFS